MSRFLDLSSEMLTCPGLAFDKIKSVRPAGMSVFLIVLASISFYLSALLIVGLNSDVSINLSMLPAIFSIGIAFGLFLFVFSALTHLSATFLRFYGNVVGLFHTFCCASIALTILLPVCLLFFCRIIPSYFLSASVVAVLYVWLSYLSIAAGRVYGCSRGKGFLIVTAPFSVMIVTVFCVGIIRILTNLFYF